MKGLRGVFQPKGSSAWWIQYFDASGRRRREKIGSKADAKSVVEHRRSDARRGVKLPENLRAKPVTFAELASRTLAYSKANKRSYKYDVVRMKPLLAAFGNSAAEDISRGGIQKWLDSKAPEWSQATRNRALALLKLCFRLAEEDGSIKSNPARLIRQRKENGRVRYLLPAEETKLRAVIESQYADRLPEFELSLMTGMRLSEQFTLEWTDIDMNAATIHLSKTKNGSERFVRMNSRALITVRMLHERSLGAGQVFPSKRPDWFRSAVREAGIQNFTWHCLRHTFASRLVMAGVDIRTVQELMGHKSITMTMRYAHLSPEHSARALEKLCQATATRTATEATEGATQVASVVQ